MLTLLRRGLLVFLAAFPLLSMAAPTPQQVVQGTVDELLSDIKANKAAYKADPQKLYATLDRILGPVVDAEGIAKSVMTVKYSRQASPEQIKRFEEVFKNSLMQFYGNALLEYDNQDIRVLPSSAKPSDDRASVNMEIRDSKGTVYPVSYTMTNLAGGWKVRNVIINGINIGKLFRDQFADTMQKSRELDELLARPWGNEMADESNLKLSGEVSGILGGSLKGVLADVRNAVDEVRLEIAGAAMVAGLVGRAGLADAGGDGFGIARHDLEVFGGDAVGDADGVIHTLDQNDRAVVPPARFGDRTARQGGELPGDGGDHGLGQRGIIGDQHRLRGGIVLGLRQQIRRDPRGIRGCVGDDDDLGRSCDHIDADLSENLPLGRGDIGIAGTDDLGNSADRPGAVGERGNCLRATNPIDFVHAAQRRGCEHQRRNLALRCRHDHHDALDPRDLGGDGVHQHGRRVGSRATGHVKPHGRDGRPAPAEPDALLILEKLVLRLLALMESPDARGRELEGLEMHRITGGARRIDLGRRDPDAASREIDGIEAERILRQRRVAPRSHIRNDGRDGTADILGDLALRAEKHGKAVLEIRVARRQAPARAGDLWSCSLAGRMRSHRHRSVLETRAIACCYPSGRKPATPRKSFQRLIEPKVGVPSRRTSWLLYFSFMTASGWPSNVGPSQRNGDGILMTLTRIFRMAAPLGSKAALGGLLLALGGVSIADAQYYSPHAPGTPGGLYEVAPAPRYRRPQPRTAMAA